MTRVPVPRYDLLKAKDYLFGMSSSAAAVHSNANFATSSSRSVVGRD
ncbi:MAG: hypothetical protein ACLP75_22620 [Mycobacterium sp.]